MWHDVFDYAPFARMITGFLSNFQLIAWIVAADKDTRAMLTTWVCKFKCFHLSRYLLETGNPDFVDPSVFNDKNFETRIARDAEYQTLLPSVSLDFLKSRHAYDVSFVLACRACKMPDDEFESMLHRDGCEAQMLFDIMCRNNLQLRRIRRCMEVWPNVVLNQSIESIAFAAPDVFQFMLQRIIRNPKQCGKRFVVEYNFADWPLENLKLLDDHGVFDNYMTRRYVFGRVMRQNKFQIAEYIFAKTPNLCIDEFVPFEPPSMFDWEINFAFLKHVRRPDTPQTALVIALRERIERYNMLCSSCFRRLFDWAIGRPVLYHLQKLLCQFPHAVGMIREVLIQDICEMGDTSDIPRLHIKIALKFVPMDIVREMIAPIWTRFIITIFHTYIDVLAKHNALHKHMFIHVMCNMDMHGDEIWDRHIGDKPFELLALQPQLLMPSELLCTHILTFAQMGCVRTLERIKDLSCLSLNVLIAVYGCADVQFFAAMWKRRPLTKQQFDDMMLPHLQWTNVRVMEFLLEEGFIAFRDVVMHTSRNDVYKCWWRYLVNKYGDVELLTTDDTSGLFF